MKSFVLTEKDTIILTAAESYVDRDSGFGKEFCKVTAKIRKARWVERNNKAEGLLLTDNESKILGLLYQAMGIMAIPESKLFDAMYKKLVKDVKKLLKIKDK